MHVFGAKFCFVGVVEILGTLNSKGGLSQLMDFLPSLKCKLKYDPYFFAPLYRKCILSLGGSLPLCSLLCVYEFCYRSNFFCSWKPFCLIFTFVV
jgi:hypothetical protein